MKNTITQEKIDHYLKITGTALSIVKKSPVDEKRQDTATDFLDMAERNFSDANHFYKKGEWVDAFAAVNYAHAWLDAGSRIGVFRVKDSSLFILP